MAIPTARTESSADAAVPLFRQVRPQTGPTPQAPWDTFSGEELLDQLPKVARAGDDVENHLKNWVGAARP